MRTQTSEGNAFSRLIPTLRGWFSPARDGASSEGGEAGPAASAGAQVIKMCRDFSATPGGRSRHDGPRCAEAFREDVLGPALASGEEVELHLDGTGGYGSSFLDEAFGGLVRSGRYTSAQLHDRLHIHTGDRALLQEIWSYIDDARPAASPPPSA